MMLRRSKTNCFKTLCCQHFQATLIPNIHRFPRLLRVMLPRVRPLAFESDGRQSWTRPAHGRESTNTTTQRICEMRGRCVSVWKDKAGKHAFRDSNPRTSAVEAIPLSIELWPDFSFSPAFVHYRIARRLVEGEESPKVSSASAPKTG